MRSPACARPSCWCWSRASRAASRTSLAYEQATAPAYAQDEDPRVGQDCSDFRSQAEAQAELRRDPFDPDVLDKDDGPDNPARDIAPVLATAEDGSNTADDGSASSRRGDRDGRAARRNQRGKRNEDLLKSGGPRHGPAPKGTGEPRPEEYPMVRADGCYAR